MTDLTKAQREARLTLRAARRFSRRGLLQGATAVGAILASGPFLVRQAFSSSGELNLLNWSDEFPDPVLANFTATSGIKVNTTPFSQNEEQINKLQATGGEGFDLVQPTRDRAPQFQELDVLQPFDPGKIPADKLIPSMLEASSSVWTWNGGLHHLPHLWGTEALSWRTDKWSPKDLSFGDLWGEDVKGHVQGRPHSLITGIGIWLDATGKLPSNRFLDAFKDEENMKRLWGEATKFAIEHKSWIKQFWDSSDNTKSGLLENDVWLGQTWDGPVLSLKKEGKPVTYQAPKEGAIAWLDGLSLTKAARNVDQAYEFIKYLYTPEVSGALADGSGYNPVIQGAEAHLSEQAKKNFAEAYPGDSLANLWWRPPEPSWYGQLRTEFADKFKAA